MSGSYHGPTEVSHKFLCKLESPDDLLKILKSRQYPKRITSQSLVGGTEASGVFETYLVIPWTHKFERHWLISGRELKQQISVREKTL